MADRFQTFAAILQSTTLAASLAVMSAAVDAQQRPQRIVSTNLCTDQILIRLVEPERIVSLTYLSWKPNATPPELHHLLKNFRQNHGLAEEVLMMDPDLVIGGAFSARFTTDLLTRLDRNIFMVVPENNFEEWYDAIRAIGEKVGEPERAQRMISDFKDALAEAQAQIPPGEFPIYANLSVNNRMPGEGTLYTQVVNAGGFRTIGQHLGFTGYREISLEKLIQIPIDLISTNTPYPNAPSIQTQNLNHPLLKDIARKAGAQVDIPARYTTCTTPETIKMVKELIAARLRIDKATTSRQSSPGKR